MAGANIENGKESLLPGPVLIMCLPSTLIPHAFNIEGTGIVICLAIVGTVVAFILQELGIETHRF